MAMGQFMTPTPSPPLELDTTNSSQVSLHKTEIFLNVSGYTMKHFHISLYTNTTVKQEMVGIEIQEPSGNSEVCSRLAGSCHSWIWTYLKHVQANLHLTTGTDHEEIENIQTLSCKCK